MNQAKVYQFAIYDGWNDESRLSSRWATHGAIELIRVGIIQEHTGTLIDAGHLDANGMTERGFMPSDETSLRYGDDTRDFRSQDAGRLNHIREP
jgi:hypothetical protein